MKISFIGFGNMAKAIAHGLLQYSDRYTLSAASPSLKQEINAEGIICNNDNQAVVKEADIVILAVKPTKIAEVLLALASVLPTDCLIISVAAGYTLNRLADHCHPNQAIIRAMPNTPLAVGEGATPLIKNSHVTASQAEGAAQLFECAGIIHWVEHEEEMELFTALSGSGPAYVFLFMEAMIAAAQRLGLDASTARTFTLQTLKGAIKLAEHSTLSPVELRKKITSPAGTTAAAIEILEQNQFAELIFDAINAACERARHLGKL